MKKIAIAVSAAVLCGCSMTTENCTVLIPVAGRCFCQMQCKVTSTAGSTVSGNMKLIVRNDDNQEHEVSLPTQEAQTLMPGAISTFAIAAQPPQRVLSGKTASFIIPFAMTEGLLEASRQVIVLVDGKSHIVGLRVQK